VAGNKRKSKKKMKPNVEITSQHTAAAAAEISAAAGLSTADAATWRVVGAAVQGASHQRFDLPCQDAQAFRVLPNGDLVIALADGAGSARFSELGAARAVEEALEALAAGLESARPESPDAWERLFCDAFASAQQALTALALAAGESPRDYASTLTCIVADAERLAVGQIGDGAVVGIDQNGQMFTATRLQRGEYANETHFVTQEDALEQAVIDVSLPPVNALAVMSDGLIRLGLKMPAQDPHEPFFEPLFRFVNAVENEQEAAVQLERFLGSERVNSRTDDDKALVLAIRVPPLPGIGPDVAVSEQSSSTSAEVEAPLNGSDK
jgi:hypothetical protein